MESYKDHYLVEDLEPTADILLARHLKRAEEWIPDQYVPWELAAGIEDNEEWNPDIFPLPDGLRSAVFVNLLTEDNLPYYHAHIASIFGRKDSALRNWNGRWTAEEGRHAIVIRDYLVVTQAVNSIVLERARMQQVSGGETPEPPGVARTLAYVTLQELATRISHANTGLMLGKLSQQSGQKPHLQRGYKAGEAVMTRVAKDENLHYDFYRNLFAALIEIDPSNAVIALEAEVSHFQMPGTGIPDFGKHSKEIRDAGIYDFSIHHDKILKPVVMDRWQIPKLNGLSPEADKARVKLIEHIARIGELGSRLVTRRQERVEKEAGRLGVLADQSELSIS